ncbi:hypothetical protein G6011_05198 [Alternaria panax]|uniref:Uncharacterized protein n=1 Tax=Alternaria panax TaxID=48097 RepID=A0AAD4FC66_9PLEO|nr:hypothetical protein G6011_05198 [Alternaria panax]
MTEAVPVTGPLPKQEPRNKGATLENISFLTDGTTHDVATSEADPTESEYNVAEPQTHPEFPSAAVVLSSNFTWYCSAAAQTLPPNDAKEFQKIYHREPTSQELLKKIGSAALGHYAPGPSANPYDVVLGRPFATATIVKRRPNYADSFFQTDDVAQCDKFLLRAKVKASLLVNRQRDVALSAGFRVWSETRDEYIVHSEQLQINIQFDTRGNAINANIDGLSLPNIHGEEIKIGREAKGNASSAVSIFIPQPTPLSESFHSAVDKRSTPQRIRIVEPRVPSESSDPEPIEWYGYIERIPTDATERINSEEEEQQKTVDAKKCKNEPVREDQDKPKEGKGNEKTGMMIGGERFADEYIVHDATASGLPSSITISDTNADVSKKRKSENRWEPETAASSSKRPKTSPTRSNSLEAGTGTDKDGFAPHQYEYAERNDAKSTHIDYRRSSKDQVSPPSQNVQFSTTPGTYENVAGTEDKPNVCSSPAHRGSRHRSHSPGDCRSSNRSRSRSSVGRQSEDQYEEERQRNKVALEMENDSRKHSGYTDEQSHPREGRDSDVQKVDAVDLLSARKLEDDRRLGQAQRIEAEELAEIQQQEESEIQRAREAKNRRKLEIEERRQLQEAKRQRGQDEKGRDRYRRRRRNDSQDKNEKGHTQTVKQEVEASKSVDAYAVAREAEARRRERVFAARETGGAESGGRERLPAENERFGRPKFERQEPEKQVEEKKATKPRPSRAPRGELERYDPRKKFGGGKSR